MADEDKQFDATPAKLQKAREEGQVIKSKDLSNAVGMLVMFFFLVKMAPFFWDQFSMLFIKLYEQIPNKEIDDIGLSYLLFLTLVPSVLLVAPALILAAIVAIIGDIAQVGPLITGKPLMPKLDKLNPINGFKNIFSVKTIFELVKNIIKVSILGVVGYVVYMAHIPSILSLVAIENSFSILFEFGNIVIEFVMKAGFLYVVIGLADYMFNRWKFLKDQKMSMKEIKDEYKNSEGDPHVKAHLRQKRMEMLQQSMLEAVPTADFVTTNPVHVAVALKYEAEEMRAPKVIAKGTELFAKKIIDIARKHDVPVIENPPIARALFRLVDINREVPPELYKAVAEILMFVYNLREGYKNKKDQVK